MIIANVFLFLIMAYKYFPQTEEDIKEMLDVSGVKSLSDLYGEITLQKIHRSKIAELAQLM